MRILLCLLVVAACACGEDGEPSQPGQPGTPPATARPALAGEPAPAGQPAPDAVAIERVDDTRWIVDDSAVTRVAAELALGALELEATAGGARAIRRVPPDAWFAALDLAAGDEIVAVSGVAPDPASLRALAAAIHAQGEVKLVVRRAGAEITRRYVLASKLLVPSYAHLPVPITPTPEEEKVAAAMRTGIRVAGPDLREIDRQVLVALSPSLLGKTDPLRLGSHDAAVEGTPVALALGLTMHDTVRSLDDAPVSSVWDLMVQLQSTTRPELSLLIDRLGEPVTLRYRVVDGMVDRAALATALTAWDAAQRADEASRPLVATPRPIDTVRAPDPAADAIRDRIARGIAKIDDRTYSIERKALGDLLTGGAAVARDARIVPAVKDGQPIGFKLYAIRPGSLAASLGLENGDTIHAIDRVQLTSLDNGLRVYTDIERRLKAGTLKSIAVELSRRGQQMTLTYRLR